ncbi:MAG: AlpA family transcriptional regulator [Rubrivivax sp.]|nr:AlpA family transcriptional regulator [Rubrivivax sp.]
MDADNMTEQLLRLPAVQQATGYGRSSIYALIKRGAFPQPVKLAGGGAVAWRSSDVQRWIAGQQPKAAA